MNFVANDIDYKLLNDEIRKADDITISNCLGQRFIGAGMSDKNIVIEGVPGNALGAYLNGSTITVNGNAQDATGDTMNEGKIVIHGSIGDAAGYAMRGGSIYVKGDAGYRAGIHMKAYKEKSPSLVIGGRAGSFLGEYQAGGTIIVLGLENDDSIVGNFTCTGMHGGQMFIRSKCEGVHFPHQVSATAATAEDLKTIEPQIDEFCKLFGYNKEEIMNSDFTMVKPNSKNPYKQMYVAN